MSMEAHPGASSTVSPGSGEVRGGHDGRSMAACPVSVSSALDGDDRNIGRVSRKRLRDDVAVAAEQHHAPQPVAYGRDQVVERAPLASPPATHTTGS